MSKYRHMHTSRIVLVLIDFIFGLIELLLALRIILRLFAANPSTPFVSWIYQVSDSVMYPFRGIFPSPVLSGGYLLDISAVVALLIYSVLAYLISELVRYVSYQSTRYYSETVVKERK